jgi:hypothetical protein
MKIRPVGAEWYNADERTDMKKATVAFRNFTNAPNITFYSIGDIKEVKCNLTISIRIF